MKMHLIETDTFPIEFVSKVAERESWRKEIHRPIYHVHKWWAKRLGSVFRGVLLGAALPANSDLEDAFYRQHRFDELTVWDPFMGSGTTVGEAHKLGMKALGRDINAVAVRSVRVAFGRLDLAAINNAFEQLDATVGRKIRHLYTTTDSNDDEADVLYWFWVMRANCPSCNAIVDLFPTRTFARNAYPARKPEIQVLCPSCDKVFEATSETATVVCRHCSAEFDANEGEASGASASCRECGTRFSILSALGGKRPAFWLYAKLILRRDGRKEYLAATEGDRNAYAAAEAELESAESAGLVQLPRLKLQEGNNTSQAIRYGFKQWRDFFNARQLLALGYLRDAVLGIADSEAREALLTLFSGTLEFNNMFASYKGEGTGAVRHMFSHHILKPEKVPIEANVWGTSKSSGSFSTLYQSRLLRAIGYRMAPKEVSLADSEQTLEATAPFNPTLVDWPYDPSSLPTGGIALSQGDSSSSGLSAASLDLVVTDPPFFDNVHYSELADFFHAWQDTTSDSSSTRDPREVQDADCVLFRDKLARVFAECSRVLKDDGLLVFSYHHSREDGWTAVAEAILDAGFLVVNSQPVKAEMSGATPKSQAKSPIQLDIILVCRKADFAHGTHVGLAAAIAAGRSKVDRLTNAGFKLSANDVRVVIHGQALTTVRAKNDVQGVTPAAEAAAVEAYTAVRTREAGASVTVAV